MRAGVISTLSFPAAGKSFPYMPYDMKLMEQEAHAAGRPGSPYRLSPRDPSKASPQPEPNNPARYSVPPGTHHHHYLHHTPSYSPFPSQTAALIQNRPFFGLKILFRVRISVNRESVGLENEGH